LLSVLLLVLVRGRTTPADKTAVADWGLTGNIFAILWLWIDLPAPPGPTRVLLSTSDTSTVGRHGQQKHHFEACWTSELLTTYDAHTIGTSTNKSQLQRSFI
jgi:hypothetical protein